MWLVFDNFSASLVTLLFLIIVKYVNSSVLIIGAGPAGIAAASKLFSYGVKDIKIIEAEDRIGGRIKSVKLGEKFVDIGAEYCHGEDNIVAKLVKNENILKPITHNKFLTTLYTSNGSRIDDSLTQELQEAVLGYGEYENYSSNRDNYTNFKEYFLDKFKSTIMTKYSGNTSIEEILNNAIDLAEKVSLMIDGAFSWEKTSVNKHYQRSGGYQLLVWGGRGYKTVLEILMRSFPDNKNDTFLLNQKVTKISYEGNKVVVKTQHDIFEADRVIFTPSIGVLQDSYNTLFDPPLPINKERAIKCIGFDGVMKIIMQFERKWWRDDDIIFPLLWDRDDLIKISRKIDFGVKNNDGISWISAVTVLAHLPGHENILTAWLTSDFIVAVEKMDKRDVIKGLKMVLEQFFAKDYNVTELQDIITSNWRSNLNFRGTYSYEKSGVDPSIECQKDLSEPLENHFKKKVLFFAGEATNPIHYSTVHGAIETGFREAERIFNLIQNRK